MRILLDLQGCQSASRYRGIGRYSMALAQAMAKRAGDHELWLILNGLFPDAIEPIFQAFDGLIPPEHIAVFQVPGPTAEISPDNAWRARVAECIREHALEELTPDVVFVSSLFEGFVDDAVASLGANGQPLATAVTLYDLIPFIHQDSYLREPCIRDWYFRKLEYLKRAELLLAISESSRQEGIEVLGLSEHSVINISSAVDAHFKPRALPEYEAAAVLAHYGLTRPFVMYTGVIERRKNIEGLITAYALLPAALRKAHQLFIVCQAQSHDRERLLNLATKLGLDKEELVLSGFVPDEDLVTLYNLCSLFVFPSLHEGFGLPALEAMACGAPTIGSNISSIPEVIGRQDAVFDPTQPRSIADLMQHALADKDFNRSLREHALVHAACFSWNESARRALEGLELVQERRQAAGTQCSPTHLIARRPRLAYVSPLPPERTGVANYSAELLPVLGRYYDIEVVTDQVSVVLPKTVSTVPIRSVAWFEAHAHEYDRVLYQFGNSPFHRHMFGMLQRYPGVVVLHDFFLSSVLNWMEHNGDLLYAFAHALYVSHGYVALLHNMRQGREAAIEHYPCNKTVLDRASGIIVHSRYSMQAAEHWYGKGYSRDWRQIPHLRMCPPQVDRYAARARLGVRETDFLVCSFGFLDPTKLNDRLLSAWLNSALGGNSHCMLVFVGENHGGEYGAELLKKIKANVAGTRITITGYASPELFHTYLSAADLAVQLRNRSRGETSGTVLDCMAHGIPLIVNGNGAVAEYPDNILFKLEDEFADTDLIHALETLHADRELRESLTRAGQVYVRTQHDPDHVGEQYRNAVEDFALRSSSARYQSLLDSLAKITASVLSAEQYLPAAAASIAGNMARDCLRCLYVDISQLVKTDLRTGIERVTRALLLELIEAPPHGYRVEPVYAVAGGYRYARNFALKLLGIPLSGFSDDWVDVQRGDIFLGLDWAPDAVLASQDVLTRFRQTGCLIYFLVYDVLPLLHREWFPPFVSATVESWLRTITTLASGLICISRSVADELGGWLNTYSSQYAQRCKIGYFHLGADVTKSAPTLGLPADASDTLRSIAARTTFLMVGTVEPRKGYSQALGAFELLWAEGVDVNLVIVGKQGWMVEKLSMRLRNHQERGNHLFWLEEASDEYLLKLYENASVLLMASEGEGFGLPLIEAAHHELPIIVRDIPVFREVAGDHAYYFRGDDPKDMALAVKQWLDLSAQGQAPSSVSMPWRRWTDSAKLLLSVVLNENWYLTRDMTKRIESHESSDSVDEALNLCN